MLKELESVDGAAELCEQDVQRKFVATACVRRVRCRRQSRLGGSDALRLQVGHSVSNYFFEFNMHKTLGYRPLSCMRSREQHRRSHLLPQPS